MSIDYNSHPYDVRLELDKMVKAGEIKKYIIEKDRERGTVFYVMTDQGWDPEPYWQQHHLPDFYLRDAD